MHGHFSETVWRMFVHGAGGSGSCTNCALTVVATTLDPPGSGSVVGLCGIAFHSELLCVWEGGPPLFASRSGGPINHLGPGVAQRRDPSEHHSPTG